MSRFYKLSQTIWRCQYHIVWVPKYRYKVLSGEIGVEVKNCIRVFSERKGCKIADLFLFLCFQSGRSISGQALGIDGNIENNNTPDFY